MFLVVHHRSGRGEQKDQSLTTETVPVYYEISPKKDRSQNKPNRKKTDKNCPRPVSKKTKPFHDRSKKDRTDPRPVLLNNVSLICRGTEYSVISQLPSPLRPTPMDLQNSALRRSPRGGTEQSHWECFLELVRNVYLDIRYGRLGWIADASNCFSVASARRWLDSATLFHGGAVTMWNNWVPVKLNIIIWRIKILIVPTQERLLAQGIMVDSILCPISNPDEQVSRKSSISPVRALCFESYDSFRMTAQIAKDSLFVSGTRCAGYQAEKAGKPLPYVPIASASRALTPISPWRGLALQEIGFDSGLHPNQMKILCILDSVGFGGDGKPIRAKPITRLHHGFHLELNVCVSSLKKVIKSKATKRARFKFIKKKIGCLQIWLQNMKNRERGEMSNVWNNERQIDSKCPTYDELLD
ncbi:hypothetical protein LXL04_019629 [Taraxacum kok-saghyz]